MQIGLHAGALSALFTPALAREHAAQGSAPPSAAQVRDRVLAWRSHVSTSLQRAGHLSRPLGWNESGDSEVQPLDVDDLRALKLLLAYDDGKGPAPAALPDRPELDPRWVQLAASGFRDSGYPQLLVPELWLPGDFPFTFRCPLPDGHEVQAGSLAGLESECLAASEQVFSGTPFDWELWAQAARPTALRARARRGLATLGRAARRAAALDGPLFTAPLAP